MDGDAHQSAAFAALFVKLVKLGPADIGVIVCLEMMPEKRSVVEFGGVGNANQLPRLDLYGQRLIIDLPIGLVDEPGFGQQVRATFGIGSRRTGGTLQFSSRQAPESLPAGIKEFQFLLLIIGGDESGVVKPVIDEGPVALKHCFGDLREVLQYSQTQGSRAPDAVLVQDLQDPPEPHPVAEFMGRILLHIRMGNTGPGISNAVERGKILVMLYVGRNPESDAGVIGPFDYGPIDDGTVIHAVGW
jgi:hypothetical protein